MNADLALRHSDARDLPRDRAVGIYLDNHASTPLAPQAFRAMAALWAHQANASSPHVAGATAAAAVEEARVRVARLVGADASEIVFTSGATEANNIALLGVARALAEEGRRRIVVSAIEHKSVLAPAACLAKEGFEVVVCAATGDGKIDLDALRKAASSDTILVSVMAANNEIGVVQPLSDVVAIAREAGALVHSDAAQTVGKLQIDVVGLDVDYLSISAHKMYGPQGIGALYISAAAPRPQPLVHGGGQEGGLRAGTLPAPLIAGFGAAAEVASQEMHRDAAHGRVLADLFLKELGSRQVRHLSLCDHSNRLPGSLALRFEGVDADSLVQKLSGVVALSTGSACNTGHIEPSHVLLAIGQPPSAASECVRLCFSRYNSEDDAARSAELIADGIVKLRLAAGRLDQ